MNARATRKALHLAYLDQRRRFPESRVAIASGPPADHQSAAHFDVVIVDEFHHAAAKSYDRLLTHLQPKVLLGLTATPERADGKSVLHHFGGRIASEIRLWKALDQGLLSPFQYFGLAGPDVSGVKWSGGRYVASELRNVYTADHFFVKRILQELQAKVAASISSWTR